jgi:hypothetical protein
MARDAAGQIELREKQTRDVVIMTSNLCLPVQSTNTSTHCDLLSDETSIGVTEITSQGIVSFTNPHNSLKQA